MAETAAPAADAVAATASLWDWRRRMAGLFHDIRAASEPAVAWRLWRDTRAEMFENHPQTPLDPGGELPDYFDYDPALRFAVDLVAPRADTPIYMPAGGDGEVRLLPFAETAGLAGALGGELTLYWVTGYGGGAFLPFLDATSGKESYGGGRYLLDTIKSADHGTAPDGRTILDFNFAYNPSCYYPPPLDLPALPPHQPADCASAGRRKRAFAVSPVLAPIGYSGTPLPQKLGYKDGQRILFIGLPESLRDLPQSRAFAEHRETDWTNLAAGDSGYDVIHGFTTRRVELEAVAPMLRRMIDRDGMVWISWPKQASKVATDVTEDVLREVLLPTGLVDVKVAAIDAVWSGLKFVIRKQFR